MALAQGTVDQVYSALAQLERRNFHTTYANDLVTARLDRLEKKLFGHTNSGAVRRRVDMLLLGDSSAKNVSSASRVEKPESDEAPSDNRISAAKALVAKYDEQRNAAFQKERDRVARIWDDLDQGKRITNKDDREDIAFWREQLRLFLGGDGPIKATDFRDADDIHPGVQGFSAAYYQAYDEFTKHIRKAGFGNVVSSEERYLPLQKGWEFKP